MLLFHVHFEVNDVSAVEAELERDGFELRARFAYVGREPRRFEPDEPLDGARLRLSELEQGAVNIVSSLRIEQLEIACANPDDAAARLSRLIGPDVAGQVQFRPGPERFAELADWTLAHD